MLDLASPRPTPLFATGQTLDDVAPEPAVHHSRPRGSAAPDTSDPREQLRKAQRAMRVAQGAVEREAEGTARARAVLQEAADAEAALVAAEAAYRASASEWVAQGAHGDTVGDPELLARCEAARGHAYRARLAAEAVKAALQQSTWDTKRDRMTTVTMTAAEQEAREALRSAEQAARLATWPVLLAEINPKVQRALALYTELRELLPDLAGFDRLCRHNVAWKGNTNEFKAAFNTVSSLPTFTEQELVGGMYPWSKFGEQLQKDPDATFD